VAIKYSGVRDGEMLPIVLQVRTGAVDRGACIRDFSQYQDEVRSLRCMSAFRAGHKAGFIRPLQISWFANL
jgi:hypothetical protein